MLLEVAFPVDAVLLTLSVASHTSIRKGAKDLSGEVHFLVCVAVVLAPLISEFPSSQSLLDEEGSRPHLK